MSDFILGFCCLVQHASHKAKAKYKNNHQIIMVLNFYPNAKITDVLTIPEGITQLVLCVLTSASKSLTLQFYTMIFNAEQWLFLMVSNTHQLTGKTMQLIQSVWIGACWLQFADWKSLWCNGQWSRKEKGDGAWVGLWSQEISLGYDQWAILHTEGWIQLWTNCLLEDYGNIWMDHSRVHSSNCTSPGGYCSVVIDFFLHLLQLMMVICGYSWKQRLEQSYI